MMDAMDGRAMHFNSIKADEVEVVLAAASSSLGQVELGRCRRKACSTLGPLRPQTGDSVHAVFDVPDHIVRICVLRHRSVVQSGPRRVHAVGRRVADELRALQTGPMDSWPLRSMAQLVAVIEYLPMVSCCVLLQVSRAFHWAALQADFVDRASWQWDGTNMRLACMSFNPTAEGEAGMSLTVALPDPPERGEHYVFHFCEGRVRLDVRDAAPRPLDGAVPPPGDSSISRLAQCRRRVLPPARPRPVVYSYASLPEYQVRPRGIVGAVIDWFLDLLGALAWMILSLLLGIRR